MKNITYGEKHKIANHEAKCTLIALIVLICIWCLAGFGLACCPFEIFHTPIWVFAGTVGTWICAILVSVILAKFIFVDFDLGCEHESNEEAILLNNSQVEASEIEE